ncbi:phosphoribosyl-AMP cyclohydrolase, partial [Shewanella sp. 0m-11]
MTNFNQNPLGSDLLSQLDWEKTDGLIPAIVQNHLTAKVLMLGYMDKAALDQTLSTGKVTFFSRSKQRLWTKGETSGNTLDLVSIDK